MPNSIDISNYEKAPFLEDTERGNGSSSSSVNGEGFDEALGTGVKSWPARPIRWIRSPWMFFLDLCLVVLVVIFAGWKADIEPIQLQGDVTGYIPHFDSQITTFRSHPEFVSNHTSLASLKEAQEAWVDFLPRE
jgi:hypothetical protein